jgi:hypothetical protein
MTFILHKSELVTVVWSMREYRHVYGSEWVNHMEVYSESHKMFLAEEVLAISVRI